LDEDLPAVRVLFTNWHYSMLGGAQTWVYTVAKALQEVGHQPLVWSDGLGILAEKTAPFARCSTRLADLAPWDVVWGSHQITGRVPARAPRCQVIHATQNQDQEAPVAGLDAYFAVSEEVARFLEDRGFPCAGVVRQPIDTERFRSRDPARPWPPRVLYFGNYQRWVPLAAAACHRLGVPFAVCGGPTDHEGRRWDVENVLNDADLVLGQTRCVLEAMACERNAVVCSGWDPRLGYGLDGFVTPETYVEFCTTNLTGNVRGRTPTVDALVDEIRKYAPDVGPALRAQVVAHHQPLTAIRPLVEWTRSTTGRFE
jgi:hypothetical protein